MSSQQTTFNMKTGKTYPIEVNIGDKCFKLINKMTCEVQIPYHKSTFFSTQKTPRIASTTVLFGDFSILKAQFTPKRTFA